MVSFGSEKGIFVCFAKKGNSEATSRSETSQRRFKYRAEYKVVLDRFGTNGLICMGSFFAKNLVISIVLYMYCLIWEPV